MGSGNIKGKDLFDARLWKDPDSTSTFYTFIASLRKQIQDEVKQTSQTHKFIRVLRDGGRLMRCYTQNIDGLETREGLSSDLARGKGSKRRFMRKVFESPRPTYVDKDSDYDGGCEVVPLHGDLDKLRCNLCQNLTNWEEDATDLFLDGEAPHCQTCDFKAQNRRESGKRGLSVGLLRPNIVLYGENHIAENMLAPLPPFDMAHGPEVLIVMGTSLKVHGLQNLVREFAKAVHVKKGRVIFVNRTKPSESTWNDFIDDWVEMDCDDWVSDLRSRREDLWLRQGELDLKANKAAKERKKKLKCDGPLPSPGSKEMIAVVIESTNRSFNSDDSSSSDSSAEKTASSSDEQQQPKKKRQRKSKTPTTPNLNTPADTGLPTPPSSHHKGDSKKRRKAQNPKQKQPPLTNHTPWTVDKSLTPSTLRYKALEIDQTAPPEFSPLKPSVKVSVAPVLTIPELPQTQRWSCFNRNRPDLQASPSKPNPKKPTFKIYQDTTNITPPPTCSLLFQTPNDTPNKFPSKSAALPGILTPKPNASQNQNQSQPPHHSLGAPSQLYFQTPLTTENFPPHPSTVLKKMDFNTSLPAPAPAPNSASSSRFSIKINDILN